MKSKLYFVTAACALSTALSVAPQAHAQQAPAEQAPAEQALAQQASVFHFTPQPGPSQWQPNISVGAGEHGIALRSQPIADALDGAAPSSDSAQSGTQDRGSSLGRALSNSIVPFGIASGIFLLADGKNHAGQTRGAIEGIGATAVATEILKYVVHERRPSGGLHSFPSGHSSFAFALATAIGENHPNTRLPLYALATAIAASRVNVHAHYTHDVIAGAALGFGITKYFMRRNRRSAASPASTTSPLISSANGVGLSPAGISFARSF